LALLTMIAFGKHKQVELAKMFSVDPSAVSLWSKKLSDSNGKIPDHLI